MTSRSGHELAQRILHVLEKNSRNKKEAKA